MKEETKILYVDAAEKMQAKVFNDAGEIVKEFPVWKGVKDGGYYSDEGLARSINSTHQLCKCGKEMRSGWAKCDSCIGKATRERWQNMPFQEWDGDTPICLIDADEDQYFFSEDDLLAYCEDHECEPEGLMLVFCEENRMTYVDSDYWSDIWPSDRETEDVLSKELITKLDELNEIIKNHRPLSYSPGKIRTSYSKE